MRRGDDISDSELNAYLDGELSAAERRQVERWLAGHPDDARRLAQLRGVGEAIRLRYEPVADEPLPLAMRDVLARAGAPRRGGGWLRIAACLALLLAGGVAGYALRGITVEPRARAAAFLGDAVGAHVVFASEVRHPVEVAAAEEDHLVKWLTKRIGADVKAPSLVQRNFQLMGGRLLAHEGAPAAQFMYEDDRGRRLTVYVRRAGALENTVFQFAGHDALSAFYWIDQPLAYAVVAELPREQLLTVARIVYEQLE